MTNTETPTAAAPAEAQADTEAAFFYALLAGMVLLSAPNSLEGSRSIHVNALFRVPAEDELNITAHHLANMQLALSNAAVEALGLTGATDITIHQSVIMNVTMLGEMTETEFRGAAPAEPEAPAETVNEITAA